jgi:hypothetical protein
MYSGLVKNLFRVDLSSSIFRGAGVASQKQNMVGVVWYKGCMTIGEN